MKKLDEKFIKNELFEAIMKKPKNKKEEQKQINALLFYFRNRNTK